METACKSLVSKRLHLIEKWLSFHFRSWIKVCIRKFWIRNWFPYSDKKIRNLRSRYHFLCSITMARSIQRLYAGYSFIMKHFWFEKSISRFLLSIAIDIDKEDSNILDLGCWTWIIGLSLLRRFHSYKPKLFLVDIKPEFLQGNHIQSNLSIQVWIWDISHPNIITDLWGKKQEFRRHSFTIITIGAALGYSKNKKVLIDILDLVEPMGYLMILEMNNSIIWRFVSRIYQYRPLYSWTYLLENADKLWYIFNEIDIGYSFFPMNLTRKCYLLRKK